MPSITAVRGRRRGGLRSLLAGTPAAATAADARLPVPSPEDRHLLSRFSYGVTPDLVTESADAGGAMSWFLDQLAASDSSDDRAEGIGDWWPNLSWTPQRKWEAHESGELTGYDQDTDFQRWTLMKRMTAGRQVREVMAEFWSNLLHVPTPLHKVFPQRVGYDDTIRMHALGNFEELLIAAVTHPAMLCYLDNDRSTAEAPNENLGREVLELHTVGRDARYTEDDVLASTRILTGWTVDKDVTWEPYYSAEDHYVGPVQVLEFSDDNDSSDGQGLTNRYLAYLAQHPSTANRVAQRLAVRFVSDEPSAGLVSDLADVFMSSGTDITETLTALVQHPEFAQAAGAKLRTPSEDLVATYRVLQIEVLKPNDDGDVGHMILGQCNTMGQRPFDWATPDGFPDVADAWASAGRMIGSWTIHRNSSAGRPASGAAYQPEDYWYGELPVVFEEMVDRVCRRLLAQDSTAVLRKVARKAVDADRDELITEDHKVVRFRIPELLLCLLDTPTHMSR